MNLVVMTTIPASVFLGIPPAAVASLTHLRQQDLPDHFAWSFCLLRRCIELSGKSRCKDMGSYEYGGLIGGYIGVI